MQDFLEALETRSPKRRRHNNSMRFINFMEFKESNTPIPFFIIYWAYRKWCEENNIRPNKIVSKHILSKALGMFFRKKSTYPKYKKYGVKVDYLMVVYVTSEYLTFSKEEEELAFNYYHIYYDKERSLWKKKRTPRLINRKLKKLAKDQEQNIQG